VQGVLGEVEQARCKISSASLFTKCAHLESLNRTMNIHFFS